MARPDEPQWDDLDFQQAVRDTAYFMWENDNRPNGREKEYWYRALEQHLRQYNLDRGLAEPPTQKLWEN
jgi:hypothetical protein